MELIGGAIGVICIFALTILSTTEVRCIKNRRIKMRFNNIKNKKKNNDKHNRRARDRK